MIKIIIANLLMLINKIWRNKSLQERIDGSVQSRLKQIEEEIRKAKEREK